MNSTMSFLTVVSLRKSIYKHGPCACFGHRVLVVFDAATATWQLHYHRTFEKKVFFGQKTITNSNSYMRSFPTCGLFQRIYIK